LSKYILSGSTGNVGTLLTPYFSNFKKYSKSLKVKDEKIFIHLASKSNGEYSKIVSSNINYLCEIIEFCKSNNIKKFIFFSAISIYTKDDLYSISKLLGEKILKESELEVLIIRLPMILTNDSENGILNRWLKMLNNDDTIVLFNAHKKFNHFICVKDIYKFISNYTFSKNYEIVDLGSKQELTILNAVEYLKDKLKSNSTIQVEKDSQSFFDISIEKAVKEYGFNPNSTTDTLDTWLTSKGQL